MKRERAKELLPVIQAFAEGKPIQCRVNNKGWCDVDSPWWDADDYRIKPAPREWNVWMDSDGHITSRPNRDTQIRVREII